MLPTDPVKVTLSGQEYLLRFTMPRLIEVSVRSGFGFYTLYAKAVTADYNAIMWVLWCGLTIPENVALKDASPQAIAALMDTHDTLGIIDAMKLAFEASMSKTPNPPAPPTTG